MEEIKIYDTVVLLKDVKINGRLLKKGTEGCVLDIIENSNKSKKYHVEVYGIEEGCPLFSLSEDEIILKK